MDEKTEIIVNKIVEKLDNIANIINIDNNGVDIKSLYVNLHGGIPKEFYSWAKEKTEVIKWQKDLLNNPNVVLVTSLEYRIKPNNEYTIDDYYYTFKDIKAIINITTNYGINSGKISILFENEEDIKDLKESAKLLPDFIEESDKSNVKIICKEYQFYLQNYKFNYTNIDLDLNYNNDFKEVHENIMKNVAEDKSALYLFHGEPGTGKSSYIKHLINTVDKKKVIYVPPNMISYFSDPDFISFLTTNCTKSLIIIEDAEDALKSREDISHNQAVNNILNFTDGVLGDIFNIQFICTFNCQKHKIDKALLRKGRLTTIYEFEKLKKDKAQILSNSINFDTIIKEDMTLADIYNQDVKFSGTEEKKRTGFIR